MLNIPRPLAADHGTAGARGVRPIGAAELQMIFPGYSPLVDLNLNVPAIAVPGHMTLIELAILTSLVKFTGVKSFAQIGTFDGMMVRSLLDNCPELESIATVDLPVSSHASGRIGTMYRTDASNAVMFNTADIGARFRNHPRARIVRDVRKDSLGLTPQDFPTPPEFFFVDGDHSYKYCVSDTRIAHRILTRPGIMAWHDFGNVAELPGVTRALTELAEDRAYSLYWIHESPRTSLVLGVQNG